MGDRVSWVDSEWLSLDTETTGVDTATDRVVTASLLLVPPGSLVPSETHEWLVNPGVEIPPEATAVHKVTNERAREEGTDPAVALSELVARLATNWTPRVPLVVCNAPYDLSLLDAECRRHLSRPLELTGWVLDPMVIDRALDKYRKGSRNLGALCKHYGVDLAEAHTSAADALAGVGVMRAVIETHPEVGRRQLAELHHYQKAWRQQWATGYQAYARTQARQQRVPEAEIQQIVIDGSWPVRDHARVGV
jgi:DNA polymerase-3 subunit epsilon